MRLVQFKTADGRRRVATPENDGKSLRLLNNIESVCELALRAGREKTSLSDLVKAHTGNETADYQAVVDQQRLLPPLDHPHSARCYVTGTGLSHLGSADARDRMHAKVAGDAEALTDSMKMFKLGLDGGKPAPGEIGVQPEWFYKGDGTVVARPGAALAMPAFALDGGEEPEVAGIYLIGPDGRPWRLGFVIGNEFSDHVMERQNYLYLAHSKLRPCAHGPELRTGALPADLRGRVRVLRDGAVLWQREFLSGEANMSHTIANLEAHHFKYPLFRRPGDVHVHFFGTATISFADGIETRPGDVFEVEVPAFGRALRNPLARSAAEAVAVEAL